MAAPRNLSHEIGMLIRNATQDKKRRPNVVSIKKIEEETRVAIDARLQLAPRGSRKPTLEVQNLVVIFHIDGESMAPGAGSHRIAPHPDTQVRPEKIRT